jgi:inner membrane protein
MPSAFGHFLVPLAMRLGAGARVMNWRLTAFCAASAALPDLDVVGFVFRVPYGSVWGHRGASHSLMAALLWALVSLAFADRLRSKRLTVFVTVWMSTTSHTLLDAFTNGGKGVALFWPYTAERFFFPFRPIQVSPIGGRFFSERGLQVVGSEICWVGVPSLVVALGVLAWRIARARQAT